MIAGILVIMGWLSGAQATRVSLPECSMWVRSGGLLEGGEKAPVALSVNSVRYVGLVTEENIEEKN